MFIIAFSRCITNSNMFSGKILCYRELLVAQNNVKYVIDWPIVSDSICSYDNLNVRLLVLGTKEVAHSLCVLTIVNFFICS